ncbi:Retrovirus-related Pol polyprotein from transposon RE1-like protein [Drosera capensis]
MSLSLNKYPTFISSECSSPSSNPLPQSIIDEVDPPPVSIPIPAPASSRFGPIFERLYGKMTWDVVPTPQASLVIVVVGSTRSQTQYCSRVLISLDMHRSWPLYQLDIKNDFLHGDLTETVYMQQPPGYETTEENHVCHLRKSLYGLKQSPRTWFEKFSKVVQTIGFSRSSADSSLFFHRRSQRTVILLVYVDDIIITVDDTTGIVKVKTHLLKQFHTKDLGTLRYFLRIEIAKQRNSLLLNQRKYCLDLVKELGFLGCKPVDIPME